MISEYLRKQRENSHHERHDGVFYASEMGKCDRAIYFSHKIPQKELPDETIKIFHMGDVVHDMIKEIFNQNSFKYLFFEHPANITDTETNLNIDGRIDIYGMTNRNERFAVELKSIKSLAYLTSPLQQHMIQLMLYLRAKKLNEGMVSYIEKNTLQTKTYKVKYNEMIFLRTLIKARKIYKCLKAGKLPERNPTYESECNYCIFKEECEKVGD
jgi:CRISPR-associated exonuclease Cas4